MNENRQKILHMLAVGQITTDEADRLLAALENQRPSSFPLDGSEARPKVKPNYLRVVVEPMNEKQGTSPKKVNIRVPMPLLRAGVKLASLLPALARERVNEALRKEGVPFDLSQITPENLEELIAHVNGLTVDVDQARVTLFCE